jgi:hypothetical protein
VHKASHVAQLSISEKIAKVFGFRNRMQVVVTEVTYLTATAIPKLTYLGG